MGGPAPRAAPNDRPLCPDNSASTAPFGNDLGRLLPRRQLTIRNASSPRGPPPRALAPSLHRSVPRPIRRPHTMSAGIDLIAKIAGRQNLADYQKKHWHGTLRRISRHRPPATQGHPHRLPAALRHDPRLRDRGGRRSTRRRLTRYKFFDDPDDGGQDAIFGLERTLIEPGQRPQERRPALRHRAPRAAAARPGRQLQEHDRPPAEEGPGALLQDRRGALYTFGWREEGLDGADTYHRLPDARGAAAADPHRVPRRRARPSSTRRRADGYEVAIEGDLCPFCRQMFNERMAQYDGDWAKVLDDVRVRRLILSEKDRVGIGTFQPKDEKNQDATELTGDINYRKIAEYGSESDPRAFNFDGEFNIANRGIIEFIEVLKLDVAFLYDLLGASQEHKIKPKKFAQTDIDEVIIGHTNEPEYKKLQSNEFMEAFRDRTVKIDVPYITRLSDEIKIYEKDYNSRKVRGKHIAPHTIEVAAMWAVLTRLEEPKNAGLTLLQKLKLYNGKTLPGFTEDNIKELREEAEREGMHGISPRYIQDKISNALVGHPDARSVNPFMVLNELEIGPEAPLA